MSQSGDSPSWESKLEAVIVELDRRDGMLFKLVSLSSSPPSFADASAAALFLSSIWLYFSWQERLEGSGSHFSSVSSRFGWSGLGLSGPRLFGLRQVVSTSASQ